MIHYIQTNYIRPFLEAFRAPDKVTLAERELADAERCLLIAQSGLDFAKAMVRYESARVTRLAKILKPVKPTKEVSYASPNARVPVQRVH